MDAMKVMVMIKGRGADEATVMDPAAQDPAAMQAMLTAMTEYNERLVRAGIMLDGAGLKPTSAGAKVVFEGGTTSVVDGPFTEAKEIIAGYWIWQVASLEEAVEWARQCPVNADGVWQALEIRAYAGEEDFGEAYTPEIREREAAMTEQLQAKQS
jgi:hypothetical protein